MIFMHEPIPKPSYCFDLPNGTRVRIDPTLDDRVIFTVIQEGSPAESFTYREVSNVMTDYPKAGTYSQSDNNQQAIVTYLTKKASGELKPCTQ